MGPVFLTASIIGAQMISSPFSPDIGLVRIALMRWLEIISNRFHQIKPSRNLFQFRFMTATFFALARFYIPARAGYSQLAFCHRRFGSESLVGAKAPTLVLWCTVHQAAHIHQDTFVLGFTQDTHHYRAKKRERACFLIPGPKLQEIDSLNAKEPNAV